LEEALLQVYLFAGYPRAIEALGLMAKSWPKERRPNRPRNEPATSASKERWRTQGERLCRRVYGKNFEKLHANVREAHPDLADWMIWEGYGKVLSRPGLDGMTRELCTTAALAALDAPRQLRAHVRGALNLGARVTQIRSAVRLAALGCGKRQWQRAATSVEGWLDDGDQP
jgi:4-carboxymuconolactone decarboxylase